MAEYLVDTSALAKRYVSEVGTAWVEHLLIPTSGNRAFISRLAAVELISAVTRRERGRTLTAVNADTARADFRSDLVDEYQVVEVSESIVERAMELAEAHGLRGSDAVHLPTALETNVVRRAAGLPPLSVISSDIELNAAAAAEGLAVDDPNSHP